MKFWKLASAALALTLTTSANGAIISYAGYTHNTTTDIVTGYGLEWLQWDRTVGQSISSIQSQLDSLEGGGWRVASNVEMAQLFNAFNFGITFDSDENTTQFKTTGWSAYDYGAENDEIFIDMFGDTYIASGYQDCNSGECVETTRVLFGNDLDGDGRFNSAYVYDDYVDTEGFYVTGAVAIDNDARLSSWTNPSFGVALVRDVSAVPAPAAVWLFGSGLIGLAGLVRCKKS